MVTIPPGDELERPFENGRSMLTDSDDYSGPRCHDRLPCEIWIEGRRSFVSRVRLD
jgi:hypothetical protein